MKICIINNLYQPYIRGGAEKVVENQTKLLSKENQVTVITTAPKKHFIKKKEIATVDGTKVYYLKNYNLYHLLDDYKHSWLIRLFWHIADYFNFLIWARTLKILKEESPDLIITNNLKGYSIGLPLAFKKYRNQHVHVLHDLQLIDPQGTLYRPKRGAIDKLTLGMKVYAYLTKKSFEKVKKVISPSRYTLDKHINYGLFKKAEKLVLPNPLMSNGLNVNKEIIERPIFLYLGQLEEQKGVNEILDVFAHLDNDLAKLYIAGRGKLQPLVEKVAEENTNIKYLGFLLGEEKRRFLKEAFMVLVPSLCPENSPTVIYESYAQGTPVLVSDSGGQTELITEGKTGLIFKAGDSNDLSQKILSSLKIQNEIVSWQKNIQEKVKNYQGENYITKLLDFIKIINHQL